MSLTNLQAHHAKPKDKPYKIFDSEGLFHSAFKDESEFVNYLFEQDKLNDVEITKKQAKQLVMDIMKDFKSYLWVVP